MQYPPSQHNTFTSQHSHGESTQTGGRAICTRKQEEAKKNKRSTKTQIIITAVQSSQEGKVQAYAVKVYTNQAQHQLRKTW